jgi:ABC-type branched-subunit amino acid transport system substrate-binding protein
MGQKSTIMMVVLLVVGLGIGAGVGYFAAPTGTGEEIIVEVPVEVPVEVHPMEGTTITLPALYSNDPSFESYDPMQEIYGEDIQEYLDKTGIDVTFEYTSDSVARDLALALEKVQSFHAIGWDMMNGFSWSGMTSSVLSYVNDNDMVIFSCYSTSPLLSIPDDNCFRLVPNDFQQGPVDAKMVWEYGVDAVVTFHNADAYGDGIYNVFAKSYVDDWGGTLIDGGQMRAPIAETEFSSYLASMNDAAESAIPEFGKNHVGVFIISRSLEMMSLVLDYPLLTELPWFGTDATGRTYQLYTDAPKAASLCRIMSTMPTPAYSDKMWAIANEYTERCGISWAFSRLSFYDTANIYVKAALEVGEWHPIKVRDVMLDVSGSHFGTVGWCLLAESGDMPAMVYDIWGYTQDPDDPTLCHNVRFGTWSAVGDVIAWDIDMDAPRVEPSRGDDPIFDPEWKHGMEDPGWVE